MRIRIETKKFKQTARDWLIACQLMDLDVGRFRTSVPGQLVGMEQCQC